jgi:hypothetical protein
MCTFIYYMYIDLIYILFQSFVSLDFILCYMFHFIWSQTKSF